MSASNIFNNYNKVLLQENYYNYKYHPSKRKNQKEIIISLMNAIKDNDEKFELKKKDNLNDSLTTIDAMYNPHMLRLSEEEEIPFDLIKQNKIINQRKRTSKRRPNSKAIDIHRYSDCVRLSEDKKVNDAFLRVNHKKNKFKNNLKIPYINSEHKRPLSFKNKCACCNNLFKKDNNFNYNKYDILLDNNINIYNNKNFKDSLSCFMYHINYFTSKTFENKKENIVDVKPNYNNNFKIDMTSDFTKNLKKIKFKEIQRIQFDPSYYYFIQKPLIPTIRGKILKNMKKRYNRPRRRIVTSNNKSIPLKKLNI